MDNIIRRITYTPVTNTPLAERAEKIKGLEGTLYIDFPVIDSPDETYPFDTAAYYSKQTVRQPGRHLDKHYKRLQAKRLNYNTCLQLLSHRQSM